MPVVPSQIFSTRKFLFVVLSSNFFGDSDNKNN